MNMCLYASFIFLIAGIALRIALPFIIHDEINRRMKLLKGSTLYDSWSACRYGNIVEFYFFTVTNVKEFMSGDKPIVTQVGPYTYEQRTCKNAIDTFLQNGSVRYSDKNSFKFLQDRSIGLESDQLTMLNIGYVAVANKIGMDQIIIKLMEPIFKHYKSQLFWNKTVSEMIWGYDDPVLRFLNHFMAVQYKIGLYVGKNNSAGPTFEVNDGAQDTTKLGQILTFNGHREMSVWTTSLANHISGSDGSLFPPFLESTSTVNVFSADLCRSLQFLPSKKPNTVYINSVPTRKFLLSKETFLSPEEYPDNRGFCLDYPKCPESGVLDMRKCLNDSPIAISLPHFNRAHASYRSAVIGMHPRDDMDISLYIEPQSGVILQARQPVQINAIVRHHPYFPELKNVKNVTYLPIGYINTTFYVAQSVASTLMSSLIVPQMSIKVTASLIMTGASTCLVVMVCILICRRCNLCHKTESRLSENNPLIAECLPQSFEVPDHASGTESENARNDAPSLHHEYHQQIA